MKYRNLIFLHIPKAAGTTLHSILEQHYAPANQCSIYDPEQAARVLPQWPRERREAIRLLKGHLAFGLHQHLIGTSAYITLVRDPVDRIISHYYYVKRMPEHYLHRTVIERNMSLRDYAMAKLSDELDNGQLRLLAGIDNDRAVPIGSCDRRLLDLTQGYIEQHFALAGLTERFDESLALMAIELGWDWTPAYQNLNVTQDRPRQGQIDPAARAAIEQANPFDCELYAWVKNRFEKLLNQHRAEILDRVARIHEANRPQGLVRLGV